MWINRKKWKRNESGKKRKSDGKGKRNRWKSSMYCVYFYGHQFYVSLHCHSFTTGIELACSNKYLRPRNALTKMYTGRVACCSWWVTLSMRRAVGQTGRRTDGRQIVTLRLPLDAAGGRKSPSSHHCWTRWTAFMRILWCFWYFSCSVTSVLCILCINLSCYGHNCGTMLYIFRITDNHLRYLKQIKLLSGLVS